MKFILRCLKCGSGVRSQTSDRRCYKCGGEMEIIDREIEGRR